MNMKELVSTIQSLLVKVEEGNITQAEMEQLVADARELNERLIVLRYKVYEQGIFEVQPAVEQEVEVELPEIDLNIGLNEVIEETLIDQSIEQDNVSPEVIELQFSEKTELNPEVELDVDLFSAEVPNEEPIDELNFDEEEELNEEEQEEEEQEDEQIIEEKIAITSSFDEETNSETQEITHHQTSVIETEESTTIIETEETTTITRFENPIEETVIPQAEMPISSGDSETENKLKSIEKSLRINYSIVPLETLIGSFTLNERLQFINELFEGSSDSFSTAVKKLDSLDGLDAARTVVGEFASTNNWDLDSEIVEDFLVKICRRYA
jgi:hypothetical protein